MPSRPTLTTLRHFIGPRARQIAATAALLVVSIAPVEQAEAQITPMACVQGPHSSGSNQYAGCDYGSGLVGEALEHVEHPAPFHVRSTSVGTYRFGGDFSDRSEANLAAGTIRQSLLFGNVSEEYQLGTYADLGDLLTFSGSGTAILKTTLTGRFVGAAHPLYYNYYSFWLSAWRVEDGDFAPGDITGQVNVYFQEADEARVLTPGCGSTWALGVVGCAVRSRDPEHVELDLWLELTNLQDGDQLYFRAGGQTGAYAPRDGGVDFGHTARLALALDPGLGVASSSGVFLTQASTVPEPASIALMGSGLGLLGLAASRRERRSRPASRHGEVS